MSTITTLRPSGTSSDTGWTAVPSGTLAAVTSDDNDSTYADWTGTGSGIVFTTPVDSPPAGERRHQARVRVRGSHGDSWWSVILQNGALVGGTSASFETTPETIIGSWGFGLPPDNATTMSAYITAQTDDLRVIEVYLDVDSREAPTFTAQTVNGAGTVTTTISDTATPRLRASAIDLDGLNPRQYRYWVTLDGAIVWDTGVVSGPAVDRLTTALDNGTYVAHLQVWSTLGANLPYSSDEETVTFTVSVGEVPAPGNPNVTPVTGTPFYEVSACAPDVADYDNGEGWIEVQRVDCPDGGALFLPGSAGSYASGDNPGEIPVDLQVTVFGQRDDGWRPASDEVLAALWDTGSNRRSWRLLLDADGGGDPALIGRPVLEWSEDGTVVLEAAATARAPVDPYGRVKLRALLLSDDGAGDYAVTFSTEIDGVWTQLGEVIAGSGFTETFSVPAVDYTVGASLTAGTADFRFTGQIYSLEVRDTAGGLIVTPDFTGRAAGTTTFDDTLGNAWTVHAPASITSDQRITTVTIVGPLATDECASYVDYSLPRTGVGITCEHQPEPCCSYYRARTIVRDAGAIQISNWSGVFNPGIPEGLIVMWPAAAADIPEGWDRVAGLDGRYPKGIATSGTQPGTLGGAASHVHSVPAHSHDIDHNHLIGGSTGGAIQTVGSADGNPGTTARAGSHAHTLPSATGTTAGLLSGAIASGIGPVLNDPDHLEVIFLESDGNPLGVPDGAVSWTADGALTGWTDYADATGRFVKGAAAGADGGAVAPSTRDHEHIVAEHGHPGTVHTHTASDTGTVNGNMSLFSGSNSVTWATTHQHAVTIGSVITAALDPADSDGLSSQVDAGDPLYRNVRIRQNTSAGPDLPIGLICAWRGSLGTIPEHWQLCDGTNGTPDLIGRYPRGATTGIGDAGGTNDPHSHTSPSHTHGTTGHAHGVSTGPATGGTANVTNGGVNVSRAAHTHTAVDTASTSPEAGESTSGILADTTSEPLHEEVAFVQLVEEPTPPAAPATFCLTWSDDEHLVRSEGPEGPLWARVLGKFTWDVERPFASAVGVSGTTFVSSAPPGGRNMHMTAAVESEQALAELREVLERPLVLISPSDASEVWAAPVAESVRVVAVGRIRQVTADFIGTGPQPPPQLADVGV